MSAAADKDHMTVEDPLGSDEVEGDSEDGEYGASEARSDSGSGEEEEDDDEENGKLLKATLEARQAARAAGNHPLQQSFRAAAAQLLEKYATAGKEKQRKGKEPGPVGVDSKGGNLDEQQASLDEELEVEAGEEEESEGESAAGSSEEDELDASSDSSSSGVTGDHDQPAQLEQPAAAQLGDAQRTDRQRAHAEAQSSGQTHVHLTNADDSVDGIPYTIPAPSSYAAFAQLAEGQGPASLGLIIRRIRACNAIALATDNRRKLQVSILCMAWLALHATHCAGQCNHCSAGD